jgi:hypothetical protein
MFGERITPNQHALARRFGLMDNLSCSGEISADGHHWLDEAFADDYDERNMFSYPRSYPCCGTDPLSFAGNRFLWQQAVAAGLSFKNWGEFEPLISVARHSVAGYLDEKYVAQPDRGEDVAHAERILSDWGNMERLEALPKLTTIWLPNDHTAGLFPGAFTPQADVADNDKAVGMLVAAITQSNRNWRREPTAIFIVEDDAQGGLDHVEGHRTVGLVISPFNRMGQVVSHTYNQLSMIRTIELMLGIPPLNQFDAAAEPMRDLFTDRPDFTAYTCQPNRIALNTRNPAAAAQIPALKHWARLSERLDFSAPDRADPWKLTQILWHATRGTCTH